MLQPLGFLTALAPEFTIFGTFLTILFGSVLAEKPLGKDKSLVNFSAYFILFVLGCLAFYLVSLYIQFENSIPNPVNSLRFVDLCLSPPESITNVSAFFLFDSYALDFFSLVTKSFLLILFVPVVVVLRSYLVAERIYAYEYFVLMLVSLLGMFVMVSCQDFLLFYVALEIQALSFYALAGLRTDSLPSAEAGIKYFIIGVLASLIILFSIALLYGYTGSTNFKALALFFGYQQEFPLLPIVAVTCLWLGLFVKLGAVPLHFWTLDVYQGAPLAVMGYFSLLPKVTLVAMFLRFQYFVFSGPWVSASLQRVVELADLLTPKGWFGVRSVLEFYRDTCLN